MCAFANVSGSLKEGDIVQKERGVGGYKGRRGRRVKRRGTERRRNRETGRRRRVGGGGREADRVGWVFCVIFM